MNPSTSDSNFEKFRRERRQRRAQFGGMPATAAKPHAASDVEAYEARQVHETRLTRDVQDFLAEATKQAASIVEKVTQIAEAEAAQRLAREMQEFLEETVRRAARFMTLVQARAQPGAAVQDIEPQVHNLVGQVLDGFRSEGTAQLPDKHIGQDPFAGDPPQGERSQADGAASTSDAEHGTEQHQQQASAPRPAPKKDLSGVLPERVFQDPETLKRALKALVKTRILTQEEARDIYKSALQAAAT